MAKKNANGDNPLGNNKRVKMAEPMEIEEDDPPSLQQVSLGTGTASREEPTREAESRLNAKRALLDDFQKQLKEANQTLSDLSKDITNAIKSGNTELEAKLIQREKEAKERAKDLKSEVEGIQREVELLAAEVRDRNDRESKRVRKTGPALIELTPEDFDRIIESIPMVPETSTHHPDQQAILFGPFNRPEISWPILREGRNWRLDLEFLPNLLAPEGQNAVRPAARVILDRLKPANSENYHLVAAVSGSGKTSAFADVARSYFVIYMECGSEAERSAFRKSRGKDQGFLQMVQNVKDLMQEGQHRVNSIHAERIATVEIVCRIAQLYRLIQLKPDLTPIEFYIHQRMVRDEWLSKLRRQLKNLSTDSSQVLMTHMREKLNERSVGQFVLAVDEIEPAAKAFENYFDPEPDKRHGLLVPMSRAIASLQSIADYKVIFAGTASSFDREPTVRSGIGKDASLVLYRIKVSEMFPVATLDACRRFLGRLNLDGVLDLGALTDDVEFDKDFSLDDQGHTTEELLNYCVVDTRFRVLMRVVIELSKARPTMSDPKAVVFGGAVETAIREWKADLQDHLRRALKDRSHRRDAEAFGAILVQLWTGLALNGGRFSIFTETEDLMKLGLGNFSGNQTVTEEGESGNQTVTEAAESKKPVMQEFGAYDVTEPLVMMGIRDTLASNKDIVIISSYRTTLVEFARFLQNHGNIPGKGNLFERIVFQALCRQDFQGKKVAELPFVKPFLLPKHKNSWWATTRFHAKNLWSHHQLQKDMTTPSFLRSDQAKGVVYSPESTARFDGVLMLDHTHAITLGITVWTEVVPKWKIESQFLSTDLTQAYYLADGSKVNKNCLTERSEWEKLNLNKVHSIRIHIALPRFAKSNLEGLQVAEDELAIHLDHENCHLLFGDDASLYVLLSRATGLPLDKWGAPPAQPKRRRRGLFG